MNLNDILFGNKADKNKYKGSRVESLIQENAIFKTQKLESVKFEIENETVQQILERSDFHKLRKKLSKNLILNGSGALAIIPHAGKYYVMVLENVLYSAMGKDELWVEGTTGSTIVIQNQVYPIITKIYYKDGKPAVDRFVRITEEKGEIEEVEVVETFFYQSPTLPVEIFANNEDEVSDVEYFKVNGSLERLDYLDGELRPEFELSRTTPYFNTNFTDADPEEETKALRDGKNYMEEHSFDAKVREGQTIMPANIGYMQLKQLVDVLEIDIRQKLGMVELPGMEKGTNKHTAEIIYKQEYAIDYLTNVRQARETHYNQFFKKLADLVGTERIEIELKLNEITQSKLDLLKAALEAENAKTTQVGMQQAPQQEEKGE